MSGLKQHPQHRELKAHLDTLPPGALVAEEPQVGGGGRGRAEAGACPGAVDRRENCRTGGGGAGISTPGGENEARRNLWYERRG